MSGTNPDIVFEENRESVQPGGNDYSALEQQPAMVVAVREEEPQNQASQVVVAELDQPDEGASPLEATRPDETMTRGITVGIGPGGATIVEINNSPRDAGVDLARADEAARQAEQAGQEPQAANEQPQQAELEAAPGPAMTAEKQPQAAPDQEAAQIDQAAAYVQDVDQYLAAHQEAAGATPAEMAATVAMLDEQPTEQEIHQAEAMQRDAEASAKRQEAELPGAENRESGAERSSNSMADQFRAAYESIKAERVALEEGHEQGNSQEGGRGEAAAAFRSSGR